MRLTPSTAFRFRFFVQKSLIHAATTDPHTGHTGAVEADFDVQVCRPGQTSFTTAADGEHVITELGLGWYECEVTTTTNYIDATTGPGTIVIDYNPGVLGDGFNDARIWDQQYHVGYDPSDLKLWLASAPNALASGRVDSSVGAMAASVVTASAIASNAITSAKIAADAIGASQIAANAIGASELATDAVTEIQSGLATAANLALVQADTDDIQVSLAALPAAVWDFVTEGTTKAVEAFRGITAFAMGKAAFSGTNRKYRNIADTKDVIDATVDATGRTAVTRDLA